MAKKTDFNIVPTHLAVKAMRDNGYKNAAYAIAELLDNSIQAGAKEVELICREKYVMVSQRQRATIQQIAVIDNGSGMDKDVLRIALQFGNGTRLESGLAEGIGRFGMGLPSSSISQCRKVEVWSWQKGPEKALYSYLSLNEIVAGKLYEVPEPQPKAIPEYWRFAGKNFGKSGTLVVWSDIDRCVWRSARAIIENSEFVIGRMYRKFLEKGLVKIRLVTADDDNPENVTERYALPNDPLYLMKKTSCEAPWDKDAMFQEWGGDSSDITINFNGKKHKVKIRFSYAKPETRPGPQAGNLPHGKHAAKNVGVSVVRADRELELDDSWAVPYNPTERWWGCEVSFQPGLDELFGVTNNKQHAHNFSLLSKFDYDAVLKDRSITDVKEEMLENEDPLGPLLEIGNRIHSNLRALRELLKVQTKGRGTARKRYDPNSPEARATEATKQRQEDGYKGATDKDEGLPADERKKLVAAALEEDGTTPQDARQLSSVLIDSGIKYTFATAGIDTPAFFNVKLRGGTLIITLNSEHPAYQHLMEVLLDEEAESAGVADLRERLQKARDGLKLLLEAWARYEDEQPDGKRRSSAQQARQDWGRIARQFLEGED